MGHERRHAIVVSGYGKDVDEARRAALRIFSDDPAHGWNGQNVSGTVPCPANGERSFLVGPDGGMEGRTISDRGNERRDRFVAWLRERADEPGYARAFLVRWCEVLFGDDHYDHHAFVTRHDDDSDLTDVSAPRQGSVPTP